MNPTEDWLMEKNSEYRTEEMPPEQRPLRAIADWSEEHGCSVSLNSPTARFILGWFLQHTKSDSHETKPMLKGVFFFDASFWPLDVPLIYGTVNVCAFESLSTMPQELKQAIADDPNALEALTGVWADSLDYALGVDDLSRTHTSGFSASLIESGRRELMAAAALLLEASPNQKALERARMATEMNLKALLAVRAALTEVKARRRIGHDLAKAVGRCLALDPPPDLLSADEVNAAFPGIEDRYSGETRSHRHLWVGYRTALAVSAAVARDLTGRDCRPTLRFSKM